MKQRILIKNSTIVNEGRTFIADVLLSHGLIQKIGTIESETDHHVIDGTGKHLLPGIIDGQVHFRDPGLTHKGDLYTESKSAVAGGVTSFIDMPNTIPNSLTVESLKEKFKIASKKSLANYSFFLGVNGDTIDEVIKMDTRQFIGGIR
jgi:dihydroorotase